MIFLRRPAKDRRGKPLPLSASDRVELEKFATFVRDWSRTHLQVLAKHRDYLNLNDDQLRGAWRAAAARKKQ